MTQKLNVTVVGAGLGGHTAAAAQLKHGCDVTVLEQAGFTWGDTTIASAIRTALESAKHNQSAGR